MSERGRGRLHVPSPALIARAQLIGRNARSSSLDDRELRSVRAAIAARRDDAAVLDVRPVDTALHLISQFHASGAVDLALLVSIETLTRNLGNVRGPADPWPELRAHWLEVLAVMARESVTASGATMIEHVSLDDLSLGERIEELRLRRGLTQPQLAAVLGVSVQSVCAWENGRTTPKPTRVAAIARALHSTRRELLNGH